MDNNQITINKLNKLFELLHGDNCLELMDYLDIIQLCNENFTNLRYLIDDIENFDDTELEKHRILISYNPTMKFDFIIDNPKYNIPFNISNKNTYISFIKYLEKNNWKELYDKCVDIKNLLIYDIISFVSSIAKHDEKLNNIRYVMDHNIINFHGNEIPYNFDKLNIMSTFKIGYSMGMNFNRKRK